MARLAPLVLSLAIGTTACTQSPEAPAPTPPEAQASADAATAPTGINLTGNRINPLEAGTAARRGVVLIFTRTDCPISNRYAPEVRRLFEKYRSQGIEFWLVYPNPDVTPAQIRQHLNEYAYPIPALRDPDHQLVGLSQATITPEVAVFTPEGRLAYHGRIDNRYVDFGRTRPQATEHDLDDVLSALAKRQPVTREPQPAVGCYIDDLR